MKLIAIPSRFEADPVLRKMRNRRRRRQFDFPCWHGTLAGHACTLAVIGMGPPHCVSRTRTLIESLHPGSLLLAGFAGALDPELPQGHLHHCATGESIHTVEHIVGSPEEKRSLWQSTGRPLIDMETAHVRALCREWQIPFSVLRIVSDTAQDSLPTEVLRHSYDANRGQTTPFRMAFHLLCHPSGIPALIRFLQPLGPLREKLGEAVASTLPPPDEGY